MGLFQKLFGIKNTTKSDKGKTLKELRNNAEQAREKLYQFYIERAEELINSRSEDTPIDTNKVEEVLSKLIHERDFLIEKNNNYGPSAKAGRLDHIWPVRLQLIYIAK